MAMFRFDRYDRDEDPAQAEVDRRFEELMSTSDLEAFGASGPLTRPGPRDWSPAEDTSGFEAPDPVLTPVTTRVKVGWILLTVSILGFLFAGLALPEFASVPAVFCLVVLGISLWLLLFRPGGVGPA